VSDVDRHTVEKGQLKGYNNNTLYIIGGIKMGRITQSMLDALDLESLTMIWKKG
jgi:hypothetical protein